MEFAEYPPSMRSLTVIGKYFTFSYSNFTTESEYVYVVTLTIRYGGIGAYVIYFDFWS